MWFIIGFVSGFAVAALLIGYAMAAVTNEMSDY